MTNYAAEAGKAAKKFDNKQEIQKGASSIVENAQSFIKDTKENASEAVSDGAKFLKEESKKDLRRAEDFIRENPLKGAAYAIGLGALLSYFLLPRK